MKKHFSIGIIAAIFFAIISISSFTASAAPEIKKPAATSIVVPKDDFKYLRVDRKWKKDIMLRALNLENVNEDFKKLNSLNRDYGLALFFLDKKISDDEMYRNMDMFRSKLGKKRKGILIIYLYYNKPDYFYSTSKDADISYLAKKIIDESTFSKMKNEKGGWDAWSFSSAVISNAEHEMIQAQ